MIAVGIYHFPPLHTIRVHFWIFRNEEEQQNQDIPLEGIVVEEPPTPPQPTSEVGAETITPSNSQADDSYLAPPTLSQVQEQITCTASAHTGSSQTTSS
jgi:hypothetical protein